MSNIVNDDINEFIIKNTRLDLSNDLMDLEVYALENNVPIIDKQVQNFISIMLKINIPKNILEFGTAIGFSSIFMCEQLQGNVEITTVERDKNRIIKAKENFKKFGYENKIRLIEGDCFENFEYLDRGYDFIFIDSSKSHYEKLLNNCIQNLNKNGIIIFDNVLYKGMVASDSLVVKRKKTIVNNMRKFLKNVVNDTRFSTMLLPIGDGIMILRRN
ncbi:O-methyltransferase [Candidatus Arthromitus sp. SFB-rat-Yit]|uniref:O-methyltransferase n=1 Tax=Candidatus Arthromitus sp. SFB-rat-Yit TaxID=1041504 RepID=UPI000227A0E0|nr:O-methyltransferase [Candidatus Arthromitus sp. SFB-rat-Yit]BAK81255.1 caffeoyl-CoA O-methyltransferase [Candidatus Arthromitus sp. SFB-rat-Yit]